MSVEMKITTSVEIHETIKRNSQDSYVGLMVAAEATDPQARMNVILSSLDKIRTPITLKGTITFNSMCPCGVTDTNTLVTLPMVDTLQSCGKPNHWVVKYHA